MCKPFVFLMYHFLTHDCTYFASADFYRVTKKVLAFLLGSKTCEKMSEKCEFCQKWDFEIVNFVKNVILKMWILRKMRFWKCEFCKKWDFEIVNFVKNETLKIWILSKMRFSKCEFCEKWYFENANFVKNETLTLWIFG